jgi:hypothetical protein
LPSAPFVPFDPFDPVAPVGPIRLVPLGHDPAAFGPKIVLVVVLM